MYNNKGAYYILLFFKLVKTLIDKLAKPWTVANLKMLNNN